MYWHPARAGLPFRKYLSTARPLRSCTCASPGAVRVFAQGREGHSPEGLPGLIRSAKHCVLIPENPLAFCGSPELPDKRRFDCSPCLGLEIHSKANSASPLQRGAAPDADRLAAQPGTGVAPKCLSILLRPICYGMYSYWGTGALLCF